MQSTIENKLLTEPGSFEPSQAVRILSYLHPKRHLAFQSDASLSFPVSDMNSLVQEASTYKFQMTFLGLLGVSSPLPSYLTEPIQLEREGYEALGAFIRLFENRLYRLYFDVTNKQSLCVDSHDSSSRSLVQKISRLPGVWSSKNETVLSDLKSQKEPNTLTSKLCINHGMKRWFTHKNRSAAMLEYLIRDRIGNGEVKIEQFIESKINHQSQFLLGKKKTGMLGTHRLGTTVKDYSSAICIHIKHLPYEKISPLNEKRERYLKDIKQKVSVIVDEFLRDPIAYTIKLSFKKPVAQINCLLGEGQSIGRTAWIGRSPQYSFKINL